MPVSLSQNKQPGTEGEEKKEKEVEKGEGKRDFIWPFLGADFEASLQISCSQGSQGTH